MEKIILSNGVEMSLEGFGVFQVPDHAECKQAVLDAIKTGYRLIDTAALYMNEKRLAQPSRRLLIRGLLHGRNCS